MHASYTVSRTDSNVDSLANLSDIPEGLENEAANTPSRQGVTHRFTLTMLGEVPETVRFVSGVRLSSVVTLESGRHFNVFVGSDVNADGNPNTDRPGLIGRNSYEGPGFASVDFRVSKQFDTGTRARIELMIDFFNLFNRTNVKDVNTVWGSADINAPPPAQFGFGTARDVFNPFQTQIGVKVRF